MLNEPLRVAHEESGKQKRGKKDAAKKKPSKTKKADKKSKARKDTKPKEETEQEKKKRLEKEAEAEKKAEEKKLLDAVKKEKKKAEQAHMFSFVILKKYWHTKTGFIVSLEIRNILTNPS